MQMDKDYIEKFDVIRRYHQHKLSDEELGSFEVYILENPGIINVLEKEKAVYEAFREHESLLKENADREIGVSWQKGLAMAACLVVAVVAVFSYTGSQSDYPLQPPVILETFRGAGDNAIQVNGQPIVQFQIDMGPAELLGSNAFTAELVDPAGNTAYQRTGLVVDDDGWLIYSLAGQDALLSGNHEVRVYPDNAPGQATTYPVEFTAP